MRLASITPIEKAFGLSSLPGYSYGSVQLENAHGDVATRLEGVGNYGVQWGQPLASAPSAYDRNNGTTYLDRPAPLTRLGNGLYLQNDYRASLPSNVVNYYQPPNGVFNGRQGYVRALPGPGPQQDTGTWANQSTSSKHRLEGRYMGHGYSGMHDIRSDIGGVAYKNPAYVDYTHGMVPQMREQDALLQTQLRWSHRAQLAGGGGAPDAQVSTPAPLHLFRPPNDSEAATAAKVEGVKKMKAIRVAKAPRRSYELRIERPLYLILLGVGIGAVLLLAIKGLVSLFN